MARRLKRPRVAHGDIWLHEFAAPDKRRPVLVLSRPSLIDVLNTIIVAPITTTRHDSPMEVPLGIEDGMKNECCVNLVNIGTVRQRELFHYVSSLSPEKMRQVCEALHRAQHRGGRGTKGGRSPGAPRWNAWPFWISAG
jgi:mRNA interferase MazF